MVLPFLGGLGSALSGIGAVAGAAGALGGGGLRTYRGGQLVPDWQKKMIQSQYDRQNQLASQQLGGRAQRGINDYLGLDTAGQMGNLIGPNSMLGRRAAGDFIGSEGYNKILDQSNQRIKEQFDTVTMPGILGRFNKSGRIGSPSMQRSAEQAQAGLARGMAANEAALLQNERANQMNAVKQMNEILRRQNQAARQRALMGIQLDPAEIQRRRLAGQNQLAMGQYGRQIDTPYRPYNPALGLAGQLFRGAEMWDKYGNSGSDDDNTPPVGQRGPGGLYIGNMVD